MKFTRADVYARAMREGEQEDFRQVWDDHRRLLRVGTARDFGMTDTNRAERYAHWAFVHNKPVYHVAENIVAVGFSFSALWEHERKR